MEYLEKELNIIDPESGPDDERKTRNDRFRSTNKKESRSDGDATKGSGISDNIDEIEATLARLKKELGL